LANKSKKFQAEAEAFELKLASLKQELEEKASEITEHKKQGTEGSAIRLEALRFAILGNSGIH
jgi:hypothetical protein